MAKSLPALFQAYELDENEMQEARVLSPVTRMWLETLRASYAQEKLNLKYDPTRPKDDVSFWQEEAAITGALRLLSQILDPQ